MGEVCIMIFRRDNMGDDTGNGVSKVCLAERRYCASLLYNGILDIWVTYMYCLGLYIELSYREARVLIFMTVEFVLVSRIFEIPRKARTF